MKPSQRVRYAPSWHLAAGGRAWASPGPPSRPPCAPTRNGCHRRYSPTCSSTSRASSSASPPSSRSTSRGHHLTSSALPRRIRSPGVYDAQGARARLPLCFALCASSCVTNSSRRCEMPRPAGQPPRRIIDVVPFSYELDVLELRLHELNATVDLFVVVEAPVTHRGLRKPLVFAQHAKRFAAFAHKLMHVVVPHATSPSPQPRPSPQPQPQPRP